MLEQGDVGGVAYGKLSLLYPVLAQTCDFAVSGEFQWIAGNTVYPRVPNFTGEYWQRSAVRFDRIRNLSQVRGNNFRIRKLSAQDRICLADFLWWMRTGIIVGYNDGDGHIGVRNNCRSTVAMVIHHD